MFVFGPDEGLERDAAQKALMSVLRQDTKGNLFVFIELLAFGW